MGTIKNYLVENYRHFNSATVIDASKAYVDHLNNDGVMMMTLAGAMSTAELGISLSKMIREDKVHAITCTGANLEEDLFNLVAHDSYKRIPNYRDLSPEDEQKLLDSHLNRVTDTCIPEEEAFRKIEDIVLKHWIEADKKNESFFPHEFLFKIFASKELDHEFQIDKKDSWLYSAFEKQIPIFVPGWEDSTLGNIFAAHCINEDISSPRCVKSGIEYMIELANWYKATSSKNDIGFFQIGGGIAGDFPICVVPMIEQDLQIKTPKWAYFCQISDSTTSYGSYSGAVPNEKITWGKLDIDTPKFVIESDATIVAPLVFAYVLDL
ncbi:MAG: deoxyhypusine synthase family protein [Gammaproteobacteria bacterium]